MSAMSNYILWTFGRLKMKVMRFIECRKMRLKDGTTLSY